MSGREHMPSPGGRWVRRRDPRDGDGPRVTVTVSYVARGRVWWMIPSPKLGQQATGSATLATWHRNYDPA